MKNKSDSNQSRVTLSDHRSSTGFEKDENQAKTHQKNKHQTPKNKTGNPAEILFITSYPPRECGIATYSHDLISAINDKFSNSLSVIVCALESGEVSFEYPDEVKYVIKTSLADSYEKAALEINKNDRIRIVLIQHEFGFFRKQEQPFLQFLTGLIKPIIVVFHTVLPKPDIKLKSSITDISKICKEIIVMTHNSADILINDYEVPHDQISVIAHGTHLVLHLNKQILKKKFGFSGRHILTTFGLLSSGKSIETTLKALPEIIKTNPDVLFLVIGKTHPEVLKEEGEAYRNSLEVMVTQYNLTKHVKFINTYLTLSSLLEYLQLTDIYLFTTNDPNQAVSGTFSYAMSCGCPIISTPIPHAKEVLTEDTGIIIDFLNSEQLAHSVIKLLNDIQLRRKIKTNTLQKVVSTSWENSAVEHAMLFKDLAADKITLHYNLPSINLKQIKLLTTNTGMIQFSRVNQPDLCSGYTLDDNARALIAMGMYYIDTHDIKSIWYINKYLSFIKFCLQPDGSFLNYVDIENNFTSQNKNANLEDSNGRALWALGYIISKKGLIPGKICSEAIVIFRKVIPHIETIHSPRAMAFAIKGLYLYQESFKSIQNQILIKTLANRLIRSYKEVSDEKWQWFEDSLTYANSILPEAMLYAWLITGESEYREIAITSFNFLLSETFNENGIEVISNRGWLKKGEVASHFGEQPIDVAYTIMTLSRFYEAFGDEEYLVKMEIAFNWFLGNNRLHQTIYNPRTGGCYDGLEDSHVNINQGAESTISYLMARLTVDKYRMVKNKPVIKKMYAI